MIEICCNLINLDPLGYKEVVVLFLVPRSFEMGRFSDIQVLMGGFKGRFFALAKNTTNPGTAAKPFTVISTCKFYFT